MTLQNSTIKVAIDGVNRMREELAGKIGPNWAKNISRFTTDDEIAENVEKHTHRFFVASKYRDTLKALYDLEQLKV